MQVFQKGGTQLLAQGLGSGGLEEAHAVTVDLMLGGWALTSVAVVYWLRKGLNALPASRLLPIEYGTFTATSVLAGLVCYQEARFLREGHLQLMAVGMGLVLAGCALVGSRRAVRVRCTTDEEEEQEHAPGRLEQRLLPKDAARSDQGGFVA